MSEHQLWNELGNIYINSGAYDQAIKAYDKSIEVEPEFGWAYNNLAFAHMRQGEPEKSIPYYQRSIELLDNFSDKAVALHRLGTSYQVMDDTKNAILAFQRAVDLDMDNSVYRDDLAVAMAEYAYEEEEKIEADVAEVAEDIAKAVEDVAEAVEEVAESVEDVAEAVEDVAEMAEAVEDIAEAVEEAAEMVEATEEIAEAVEEVAEAVEEVAEAVEEVAEAVEEVETEEASAKSDFATWLEKTVEKLSDKAFAKKSAAFEDAPIAIPEYVDQAEVIAGLISVVESQALEPDEGDALAESVDVPEAAVEAVAQPELVAETEEDEAIEEITEAAEDVAEAVEDVAEAVEEVADAIEDVADAVEKIAEALAESLDEPEEEVETVAQDEPVGEAEVGPESLDEPEAEVEAVAQDELVVEAAVERQEARDEDIPSVPLAIVKDLIPVLNSIEDDDLDVNVDDLMAAISQEMALDEDDLIDDVIEETPSLALEDEIEEDEEEILLDELDDEELDNEDDDELISQEDHQEETPAFLPSDEMIADPGLSGNGNGHKSNDKEINMGTATIWGELGNVFYTAGVFEGAYLAYKKAIELDANFGLAFNNLALLHVRDGEYLKAAELYLKSINMLGDNASKVVSWNNLGNTFRALEEYEQAEQAYRKADELDTEKTTVKNWTRYGLLHTPSS